MTHTIAGVLTHRVLLTRADIIALTIGRLEDATDIRRTLHGLHIPSTVNVTVNADGETDITLELTWEERQ